ncbi:putative tetratricopeptide-like helical domain superfamily [Helianthus annuus]|uniref:Tetratricopeptide-like helical domain superfamily n=3 Tax=Helianthus annuus TaxID=4232 RepID=A0A9K3H3S5_HELAN|nr:putative tetratricopeptide-like helical domain superfamily [Helianthus annuus]KAJ0456245.1 putative tetratricopeptide-like helical domain superfamily [Helianthus annuus]KAJ0473516.1 putative tetratricopeptide-like helical domain superfamily [Helianthus annuus]
MSNSSSRLGSFKPVSKWMLNKAFAYFIIHFRTPAYMATISRIFRTFSTSASKSPAKSISDDLYNERNLKRVVENFKKLSESHLFRKQANVYDKTVRRLASAKKHKWVEEILEDQKQYNDITKEGFAVRLISLYGKSGMFDHAHKVFDEMPDRNCPQTVKCFNALLGACVNAKKFDKVDELFRELPEKISVKPDVVSYNTVIKACCEMGSFELARSVFVYGEEVWAKMMDTSVLPDIRSYNAKLVGLVSEKKVDEAVELFGQLGSKNVKADVFGYNAIINGCCNNGDLEGAKKWYAKLVESDCAPNKATFATLIRFACKVSDFDWAVELFKQTFEHKGLVDPNVMQLVIDGLVKESKTDEAKKLVEIGNSSKFRRYSLIMPADE